MPPFRTKYAVVYVRLAGHSRRVSALRLDGAKDGMIRVFLRGRTYAVPTPSVIRARRSLAARALHIRLAAEYGRLLSTMKALSLERHEFEDHDRNDPRRPRARRSPSRPSDDSLSQPPSSPSPVPAAPAGTTSQSPSVSNSAVSTARQSNRLFFASAPRLAGTGSAVKEETHANRGPEGDTARLLGTGSGAALG